ncbi:hypothetical protein [Paenibacillus polymyxa]|nr:hypothetical protein [Paenibacillus polymyxa]
MYKNGRLINGKLYLKTIAGNWISLRFLAQADRKAMYMNLDWLDSMYRRLVKEVAGKAVGLEKRIEIRKH